VYLGYVVLKFKTYPNNFMILVFLLLPLLLFYQTVPMLVRDLVKHEFTKHIDWMPHLRALLRRIRLGVV
jgi:hypothetical protein